MKVEQLSLADYNKIKNIPVVNQDLSASGFTPAANTYYRHTGTTGTYKQGVIYYYDGTEYKALDGAGGITDVKVNGTSVVTDGVANIPPASKTVNGIVTTGTQTLTGHKTIEYNKGSLTFASNTSSEYAKLSYDRGFRISGPYSNNPPKLCIGALNSPAETILSKEGLEFKLYDKSVAIKFLPYGSSSYKAITIPSDNTGTMMVAPSTWSSGTSGTVKLTGSGTYQIYMNNGNHNINFGVVYWDGSTVTCGQIAMVSSSTGYYLEISGSGVITVYNEDFNGHSSTATTDTIYYRKIGI